jgi:hypothetical protein
MGRRPPLLCTPALTVDRCKFTPSGQSESDRCRCPSAKITCSKAELPTAWIEAQNASSDLIRVPENRETFVDPTLFHAASNSERAASF